MKLPREFYARDCLTVAEALIGKILVHRSKTGTRSGRIVETEAYVHEEDQACHARVGRTKRTALLYGPPGYAYVFLIYGMYDCFNVVTEPEDSPAAVLLRAVEPLAGAEGTTDGPGKMCRALGITRALNGADLTGKTIYIEEGGGAAPRIITTPRIGIDYAGEWVHKPWRFIDADSEHVSHRKFDGRRHRR